MQAYLKLIAAAERELLIANAYFVPTPAILAALEDAARRCVAVTLVTNSPETNDLPEISMVGRGYYKTLLAVNQTPEVLSCADPEAGLQIWEWIGRTDGDPVQQGTMHSKFAVVDRRVALVGSYNLDPRSERLKRRGIRRSGRRHLPFSRDARRAVRIGAVGPAEIQFNSRRCIDRKMPLCISPS
jgi:putative cardiolipin synthase